MGTKFNNKKIAMDFLNIQETNGIKFEREDDSLIIKHEVDQEEPMSNDDQNLVKLEANTDFENELKELPELNANEDVDKPKIMDTMKIKEETFQSVTQETYELEDEVSVSVNGAAASCNFCHQNFVDGSELDSHILVHHKDQIGDLREFLVTGTVNTTTSKDKKTDPPKTSKTSKRRRRSCAFECKFCGKIFNRRLNFDSHILALHKEEISDIGDVILSKIHKCEHCDYKTTRSCDLKRHNSVNHSKAVLLKCDTCEFKTFKSTEMAKHRLSKQLLHCSYCPRKFTRKINLDSHVLAVHNDKSNDITEALLSKIHKCQDCDYKTSRSEDLKRHVFLNHKKVLPLLKCDSCNFKASTEERLTQHYSMHSLKSCSCCDKTFSRKWQLDAHIFSNHRNEIDDVNQVISSPIHKCDKCAYATVRLGDLKKHLLRHSDAKTTEVLKCKKCTFTTTAEEQLVQHNLTHSRETCSYCDKCFNHKSDLDAHLFVYHRDRIDDVMEVTTLPVLRCDKCTYETVRSSDLRKHLSRHSDGETVLKCDKCNFETTKKFWLAKHQKNHLKVSTG